MVYSQLWGSRSSMNALSTTKIGKTVTVAELQTTDHAMLRKLMAMGVLPGVDVTLEQRFPSYIVKIGRTRAALDHETVKSIWVLS